MTDLTTPFYSPEAVAAGVTLFWDAFIKPAVDAVKGKVAEKAAAEQENQRWIAAAEDYRASLIRHYGSLPRAGRNRRNATAGAVSQSPTARGCWIGCWGCQRKGRPSFHALRGMRLPTLRVE